MLVCLLRRLPSPIVRGTTTWRTLGTYCRQPDVLLGLTEAQVELRDAAAKFAEVEIKPIADAIHRDDKFPMDLWTKMGDMGFNGVTVSEEYGGLGLGYMEHILVLEQLGRYSASVALSAGAHGNLCSNQIRLNGTHEQKLKYLPPLVRGDRIGGLCMSETGAGSDVVSMKMKAERIDGGWLLNGTKMWCTNGPIADTLVVYGRTGTAGSGGITAFIIDRDAMPEFRNGVCLDKWSHRGSPTGELVFENCEVPDENVLGEVNKGAYVLMSGLDYERIVFSACPLGMMQECLDLCLPYTHERKQFGKSIGEFQLIQSKLADMYMRLSLARLSVYALAKACDAGVSTKIIHKDVAAALMFAGRGCVESCSEAVQIFGGNGLTNDYPVGRLFADSKLYVIGAGTDEIRRLLVGRELFTGSAF